MRFVITCARTRHTHKSRTRIETHDKHTHTHTHKHTHTHTHTYTHTHTHTHTHIEGHQGGGTLRFVPRGPYLIYPPILFPSTSISQTFVPLILMPSPLLLFLSSPVLFLSAFSVCSMYQAHELFESLNAFLESTLFECT
jgi:hypothetical protein